MKQISGERLQDHWSSCFTQVVWLDPKEKKVVLNDGHAITFDKCLIATGKAEL